MLNIHLHCLVLDGVYRTTEGVPVFHPAPTPTAGELQALLSRIIKRLLRLLTRKGYLNEEQGMTYLASPDPDSALAPLQAAACTYRIALGPRAGQKVLSLQTVPTQAVQPTPQRCVNAHGFSLHAEVCCTADQRKKLEHLCRYITRPAIANERLTFNRAGQVVLTLKTPYRDGTTHIVMSPLEFMQRLAALVPRPRLHLIRFHGVLAPRARPREGPAWRAEDAAPSCVPRSFHPRGAKQATLRGPPCFAVPPYGALCLAYATTERRRSMINNSHAPTAARTCLRLWPLSQPLR